MKYGESTFDILYLLIAIITGALILRKAKNRTERMMGAAILILGGGDASHLVPRVLNYFVDADFTAALGIGKLVTSITMTIFYVLMYEIACACYGLNKGALKSDTTASTAQNADGTDTSKAQNNLRTAVYVLAAIRILICLFPQNGWLTNEGGVLWGVLRNLPFVALGVIVMLVYYQNREQIAEFKRIWLWILLSFAFYIPVAVFASLLPILGMLMLPKTICYIAIIVAFYRLHMLAH